MKIQSNFKALGDLLSEIPQIESGQEGQLRGGFYAIVSTTIGTLGLQNGCQSGCKDSCKTGCVSDCKVACDISCQNACENRCPIEIDPTDPDPTNPTDASNVVGSSVLVGFSIAF